MNFRKNTKLTKAPRVPHKTSGGRIANKCHTKTSRNGITHDLRIGKTCFSTCVPRAEEGVPRYAINKNNPGEERSPEMHSVHRKRERVATPCMSNGRRHGQKNSGTSQYTRPLTPGKSPFLHVSLRSLTKQKCKRMLSNLKQQTMMKCIQSGSGVLSNQM